MKFERKHKIGVDEINRKYEMTNRALIVAFQNIASYHSDSINYGILDIPKTFLTWFVVDWKVKVIKRPKYGEVITIKTWGRNANKCFSYRDYEVYINNELCVQATSKWILYNLKSKAYENISDELLKLYGNDDNLSVFEVKELEHLKTLDKYDEKKEIIIRKSDLDFNNHVNNVKYFDYLNANEYNNFRITYRKEIKADDTIYLCHSKVSEKNLYSIIDADNNIKTIIECE